MPEIRVTVRDRFGQTAHRTIVVDVIPRPETPARVPRPGKSRAPARLGQILIEEAVITQAQLAEALERQRLTGERLGQVVLGMGLGTQERIATAIASQLGISFVRLEATPPQQDALLLVPEPIARRLEIIPITIENGTLILGMVDPFDVFAVDEIRALTTLEVEPRIITADDFQRALGQYPSPETALGDVIEEIQPPQLVRREESPESLQAIATEAPVIRLVDLIIQQAVRQGASDIHIEPQAERLRVRLRVDGMLYVAMTPPKDLHAALASRVKIVANMNIAEQRRPQDGRIECQVDGRRVDLRVSTVPTVFGETVVMRVLDRRAATVEVGQLGFSPEARRRFEQIIARPHGIIMVVGPTGSGKTTTLYATLNRLNRPEVNIVTVEDPVEYRVPGISQVQVNPMNGLTFAVGLRAFLRQDPDIIMVGEIRDTETARIATQASMTGHLVLSTLHANDTALSIARLANMGIEPFMISSSLVGVVSQRLVRKLCERCREPAVLDDDLVGPLGLAEAAAAGRIYAAKGCAFCNHVGYKGRVGVFEVMAVDSRIRDLIDKDAPIGLVRDAARDAGMQTLLDDTLAKVAGGVTSLEELFRIVLVDRPVPLGRKFGAHAGSRAHSAGG